MRVLHLNTYNSGGSYEYAAVFCTEQTHACRRSYWRMPELSDPIETGKVAITLKVLRRK